MKRKSTADHKKLQDRHRQVIQTEATAFPRVKWTRYAVLYASELVNHLTAYKLASIEYKLANGYYRYAATKEDNTA